MTRTAGVPLRSPLRLAALIGAVMVLALALLVALFAAPAANLAPRDLPVVVAGPASAELSARLASVSPGAFEITAVPDEAAADRALRDREAYAAFLAGPDGLTLHTASAASPVVASLLGQTVSALGTGPVRVVDVVPADPDDPRGTGFGAGFLPLALISMFAGILLFQLGATGGARLTGLVVYGVLAGPVGAGTLHGWLGVLPGDFWVEAGAISLFAFAAAAIVAGLGTSLGRLGLGLGGLLVVLVGNPISGVAAAPELLPQPWGVVGQWLPVGAGGALLRSATFFEGAGAGRPLAILVGYALLGVLLALVGRAGGASDGPGADPVVAGAVGTAGHADVTTR